MSDASHWSIFLNAALVNNFVLAYFLGICPFFGVSSKLETAVRMGAAVSFVMLVAFLIYWFRFTFPRFREDQLQRLAWKFLIPLSLANIALTGVFKVVF